MNWALLLFWFSKLDGRSPSLCTSFSRSLAVHPHHNQGHTTPQRRSLQKPIQPFAQRILNSTGSQYGTPPARHDRRGSARPPPLPEHLATSSRTRLNPPAAGAPKKLNSIVPGANTPGRVQAPGPPVPHTRRAEGGPGRGQRQLSRLWAPCATPAPPRPPPAAPGVPGGSARAPLLPARPRPRAPRAPTWRDPQSGWRAQCSSREGQQQRSSPSSCRSSIPPGRAGGGAGSGRPGEGAERAGCRGGGSHPSPERDCPNFNSGGEGGKAGGKEGGEGGREMGGWGGERVVGKTLEPCKSRLPRQGDAPPPPPCPPPSPPAPRLPLPGMLRPWPPAAAPCRGFPAALTAGLGAPAHTAGQGRGGERAAGKVWSRTREERGRAGAGGERRGSGAAAQPGHRISPQPAAAAAAAAVIFQAHRGSPFRARLPSSLPPPRAPPGGRCPALSPAGRPRRLRGCGSERRCSHPRALPAPRAGPAPGGSVGWVNPHPHPGGATSRTAAGRCWGCRCSPLLS